MHTITGTCGDPGIPNCSGNCIVCVPRSAASSSPANSIIISACGDGVCDSSENFGFCPTDCPETPIPFGESSASTSSVASDLCGNGICDAGESFTSCSGDCSETPIHFGATSSTPDTTIPFGETSSDPDTPIPFGGISLAPDTPIPFGGTSSAPDTPIPFGGSCPDGILEGTETCEIGVCCPGGQTCDHTCHCAVSAGGSSVSTVSCGAGKAFVYGQCVVQFTAFYSSVTTAQSSSGGGVCGNGLVNLGEQCGETGLSCLTNQYCSSCHCFPLVRCGDGIVNSAEGEQCERNTDCSSGKVCNTQCQCVPSAGGTCGDGKKTNLEQCETGIACPSGKVCSNCTCENPPLCGNGVAERGEVCEANKPCPSGQTCQGCQCVVVPVCGNGALESGEQCENDSQCLAGQACNRATCKCLGLPTTLCGNGVLNVGEDCELGHPCASSNQACNLASCSCKALEIYSVTVGPSGTYNSCGNAQIDAGEDCDIGHTCSSGAICDLAHCHCAPKANHCGDGKLDTGEQCDIGSPCADTSKACKLSSCQCVVPSLQTACGNGSLEIGEQCEVGIPCAFGWACDFPHCRCEQQEICGNGTIDPGEQCEVNQACTGPDQTCDFSSCRCRGSVVPEVVAAGTLCGNGIQEPPEECDSGDQNGRANSGCSASCTLMILSTIIQTKGQFIPPVIPLQGSERMLARGSQQLSSSAHVQRDLPSAPLTPNLNTFRASLSPLTTPSGTAGKTGPGVLIVIASGIAGGWAWTRRRKRD
ncbi:MAG: hypothetical protein WCG83_01835 [Candidatus Peregrinibacteria bacterium]